MSSKNIFIVGAFGYHNNQLDGQTIKTRNIFQLIQDRYNGIVSFFDTLIIRKNPIKLFNLFYKLICCDILLLIPCRRNLSLFLPVAYFLSKICKYEIIIICIGGWQYEFFTGKNGYKSHLFQMRLCKSVKAHLPEMQLVHDILTNECGFTNSQVFPNFRFFTPIPITENTGTLKLVFMARITEEKGYKQIFEALDILQQKGINVIMDFYGPIFHRDKDNFMKLVYKHKGNVRYCGKVEPENIHIILSQYDIMLLPTQYYTEGFPGSILDAFISGIPVIVTEWKHSHEFITEGESGYIIPFNNGIQTMVEKIIYLNKNRNKLQELKHNAQKESQKYSADIAWNIIKKYLE